MLYFCRMASILIVEDDQRVATLLKRGLEESGHIVHLAFSVAMGLKFFESITFDIIVSDVLLPDGSGFDLCHTIRTSNTVIPILMLTALGTTDDKLKGFNSGADDYMLKPFDFRELYARINVLLKRCADSNSSHQVEEILYADLKINLQTKTVSRNNTVIPLTPKEYNLLTFLVENAERVISRTEIAEKVWNTHFDTGTNFIDVYINYLRKKIDKTFPVKLIHTKPGMGFIFCIINENSD